MTCFSLLCIVLLLSLFAPAIMAWNCTIPPVIFNFGDSNSDTGGGQILRPEFFMDVHGSGRISDGRLLLDFLRESLKLKYLTTYLHLEPAPDFRNGANFALAGSIVNPQSFAPYNLRTQVFQYLNLYHHQVDVAGELREDDFREALYMLDIGQNDLKIWFDNSTYDQVMQGIQFFITNTRHAIQTIYKQGGRKFWVHNTGPLGCLRHPTRPYETADMDKQGCSASRNRAAGEFNSKLRALCEELQLKLQNSTIVYVDIYAIKLYLLVNYASYGFERRCCSKTDPHHKSVIWDGFHYTEAANSIIASMILSNNFSSPPLPFNFFCLKAA